jgi:pepsin A
MALVRALLALLLIAFTTASSRIQHEHHPVKIPLHQRQHNDKVVRQTSHGLNEETAQSHDTESSLTDESLDFGIRHWWFGNFDVGDTKNLSLQIDTASSSLAINPGLYRPSTKSKSLHHTGILSYGTWQKNGCGAADLQFSTYVDVVGMPGLVAAHQAFGSLIGEPPEGFKNAVSA